MIGTIYLDMRYLWTLNERLKARPLSFYLKNKKLANLLIFSFYNGERNTTPKLSGNFEHLHS